MKRHHSIYDLNLDPRRWRRLCRVLLRRARRDPAITQPTTAMNRKYAEILLHATRKGFIKSRAEYLARTGATA
jgi:hypothetical protein